MKKYIILIPVAGLGNRMHAIAGALDLAKRLNKKLIVFWEQTPNELNAKYSDLFEPPVDYKVVECSFRSFLIRLVQLFRFFYLFINDGNINQYRYSKDKKWIETFRCKNVFIWSYQSITWTKDFSCFSVRKDIIHEMPYKFTKGAPIIGLHIRRTDLDGAINNSPTYEFEACIEKEKRDNPEINFYLATDDLSEEESLRSKYPDLIFSNYSRSLDRNSLVGIKDALKDIYMLSRCIRIYGSYESTFSMSAANLGNIELITVVKTNH